MAVWTAPPLSYDWVWCRDAHVLTLPLHLAADFWGRCRKWVISGTAQPVPCKERLRDWGWLSMGDLAAGGYQESRAKLFTGVPGGTVRARRYKLKHEGRNLLTVITVIWWIRVPRGVVYYPSLEVLKTRLDKTLSNILLILLWAGGCVRRPPEAEVLSTVSYSLILSFCSIWSAS